MLGYAVSEWSEDHMLLLLLLPDKFMAVCALVSESME